MARRTFFSFHYKPDVHRAWVVRNSWVGGGGDGRRADAGFFDSSVFEATKRIGDDSLKRFLREGLKNTTVTCVLVGAETSLRRWVRYEILRSFLCGNGMFAVRIHSIANLDRERSEKGANPFDALAFQVEEDEDRIWFREYTSRGWVIAEDVPSMPLGDLTYEIGNMDSHTLSSVFPIYDWASDYGRENLGDWIEEAAREAGR